MSNYFTDEYTFLSEFKSRLERRYIIELKDASIRQKYHVLGEMVSEVIAKNWLETNLELHDIDHKEVYYFSMEFLMGRLITNNIMNLGLRDTIEKAFAMEDLDLNAIEHYESDAGLGNGGLGRLAACFLDSIASMGYPGFGNGIRYRYGLFEQKIEDGYQVEKPDDWLKEGYVWEVRKEEEAVLIPFGGYVSFEDGNAVYYPDEQIHAVPYDVPVVGNHNGMVTSLRLWNAEPTDKRPPHLNAFEYDTEIRRISGFLYPDDATREGKVLRIKQQYFFSAAGVQNIVRKHMAKYNDLSTLPDKIVIQINDTHPSLVIAELMRLLVDDYHIDWEQAWTITTNTCAYTNHTILAEALEKWPVDIFEPVLPRIYQIIEEINRRFCKGLLDSNYPQETVTKLAIIADGVVKMAHLAIVGSFSVNGVAALHTDILKNIEMRDFNTLYPEKFNNKTNGITHRRWLLHSNPELSAILDMVSDNWVYDPMELQKLVKKATTKKYRALIKKMKLAKKKALAERIYDEQGIELDPSSIFDIQVKRLHEYKRQLMNALHIMYVYNKLKSDADFKANYVPHSFIFGAKAASGYYFAKKVIKLINTIAHKVNQDPDTNELLKVVFVENYNVTYAESIMPACDLSEQISTASKEASGTGNMKFMMNGAITIGTLDGANVEIAELVGEDNIVLFGLTSDEVNSRYENGGYQPLDVYHNHVDLRLVIDQLTNGFFEDVDKEEFREISDRLLQQDHYFVLEDFESYRQAHERANELYKDEEAWFKASIINIAKSGYFSSDRTIRQYAEEIWNIEPLK
ncbi:glycogen/starch/alpha-glucan phosphorylase [Candidatus Xianfuyuplasma coldseepsis]|uniref:Alpha-1,4 glucan phosphorylase n=1 Tax=Candidatus Xianfuyuplasma coldseepsis TaxID=2782163 RepID=A0A7L7KNS1_9MOLU|nr:glycogen/starch/alpha-glucan phosphorylase [Xianfuyuplasma coldseepsis]QMS84297.1 glycogen/starch/alpha-glucan phosphorylase [Xianfuyuplasma coldseepsis]